MSLEEFPIINIDEYLKNDENSVLKCKEAAYCLHKYGIMIIYDSRTNGKDNDDFLNMMENYYEQTDFKTDARPEYSYQIGITPEKQEKPKNHCMKANEYTKNNKPITICPPELDKKSRFFWRIGPTPKVTKFPQLNAKPVIPSNFPEWEEKMNSWGSKLLQSVTTAAEMVAIGLDMEKSIFKNKMINGPHLLAPTGSNFYKYNTLNTVLAGFHYDLNLLTIHGKSRFPGLYIWLRNGTKVPVHVPDGCLLIQAGKQMEYLTGGYILAGFHEVIVSEKTLKTIEYKKEMKESLWRISSTLFSHTASDQILEPLEKFSTIETIKKYPRILAGDKVKKELLDINLGNSVIKP